MVRRVIAWALVLGLLAAVAWGVWWVSGFVGAASEQEDDEPVRVLAEVERRTLEESVVTRGTVGFPRIGSIEIGASGRVTGMSVSGGDTLNSNQRLMTLDGRPVVAVMGVAPFWRDLSSGARGDDVAALQMFLADLDLLAFEPDGRFGSLTEQALETWQEEHGMRDPDGVLKMGDTVVGEWPARIGQVQVEEGDFISAGDEIATLTSDSAAVSLELLPSERLQVVEGSDVRIEVAATGQRATGVVSEVSLEAIDSQGGLLYPAVVEVTDTLEVPEGTQVRLTIVVQQAEDVVAVPIAAVVSDSDGGPVVRVANPDGGIETVLVELGFSEGAWVEVTSGLSGGESVVVAESASPEQ